ncbi:MAG TPA: OmpA family protein [Gemmatimonadales bacterium]|nr:OmpA family protein [Gemmatimonadales bacterium]
MRTYRHYPRGLTRGLRLLCALALLLWTGAGLEAQQRRFLVELGAGAVYQSFDSVTKLNGAIGGVGRLGLWLPYNFSVEAEASLEGPSTVDPDSSVSTRTVIASVLYNIPLGDNNWVHLKAGGGSSKFGDPCPTDTLAPSPEIICGSSSALVAGAGLRVGVTPLLLVRGDASLTRNKAATTGDAFTNFGVSLGLSYMLGSKPIPDSDGDGILENRDRCPDTPAGAQVDGTGCPSDSDGDGVPDGVDRCANTPPGASVNASGCTQDSDGDNIADGLDRCPDTEAGVLVDPNGCPKDSDGDSIPDGLDRCSETPRGATVDALGCPGDEDGDGVLDGLDRCPRTPTGAAINPSGCPTGQGAGRQPQAAAPQAAAPPAAAPPPSGAPRAAAAPRPQPTGRTPAAARSRLVPGVLPGVGFAPGTARLRPESYVALDSIAEILLADTTVRAEIGAHTESGGIAAQNQHLSNLQADAVRTYLVTKGVNFQQVQARGYGGSVPLTTDNTPRGRLANRRVEIKPVAPGP